jgi:hypothetical protein
MREALTGIGAPVRLPRRRCGLDRACAFARLRTPARARSSTGQSIGLRIRPLTVGLFPATSTECVKPLRPEGVSCCGVHSVLCAWPSCLVVTIPVFEIRVVSLGRQKSLPKAAESAEGCQRRLPMAVVVKSFSPWGFARRLPTLPCVVGLAFFGIGGLAKKASYAEKERP